MTPTQTTAFIAASGIKPAALIFWIRLIVGGVAILASLLILIGFMHHLDSASSWDKQTFIQSIFALGFILMLIFVFVA